MYHRYSWHKTIVFYIHFFGKWFVEIKLKKLYPHLWVCEQFCCKILVENGGYSLMQAVFDFAKQSSRSAWTLTISSWLTPKNVMEGISLTHRSSIDWQLKIWSCRGLCKLHFATYCLMNPPTPSHGDLPWLVAKNIHSLFILKSCWWWHKLIKFLWFL